MLALLPAQPCAARVSAVPPLTFYCSTEKKQSEPFLAGWPWTRVTGYYEEAVGKL